MMKTLLALLFLLVSGLAQAAAIVIPADATGGPNITSSCTSPCIVYFRGDGVTQAGNSYPYHNLFYRWHFGDANAGTFSYGTSGGSDVGGGSKNVAYGPQAAHV